MPNFRHGFAEPVRRKSAQFYYRILFNSASVYCLVLELSDNLEVFSTQILAFEPESVRD